MSPRAAVLLLALSAAMARSQDAGALAGPLRRFDTDRNGRLDGDELTFARQAHNRGGRDAEPTPRRWKELLERLERDFLERRRRDFDTSGDDRLDDAERNEARKVWKSLTDQLGTLRRDITARYDRNDDGELDNRERDASRPEFERRRRELEDKAITAWKAARPAPPPS